MSNFYNCELHGNCEFISHHRDIYVCKECLVDAHAALSHGVKIDQFAFTLNAENQTAFWTLVPKKKVQIDG